MKRFVDDANPPVEAVRTMVVRDHAVGRPIPLDDAERHLAESRGQGKRIEWRFSRDGRVARHVFYGDPSAVVAIRDVLCE